jgi:DNA polymerase
LPPSQRPAPRPAAKASKRELKFDPTVIQIQDPLEPTPLSPAALNFDGKPAAPSFPPPPWVQKAQTLAELETGSRSCAACPLKKTSPGSLFGKGQTKPEFLIVLGLPPLSALRNPVYPSEEEGDLFARIVATGLGQKIEDLYVTPAIKCASAAPASELVPRIRKACARILLKEIELAAPRRILALGTLAAQALKNSSDSLATLMNSKSPFALVGDRQIPLLVTYGLDMALKDPALEGRILEDLTKLRDAPRP